MLSKEHLLKESLLFKAGKLNLVLHVSYVHYKLLPSLIFFSCLFTLRYFGQASTGSDESTDSHLLLRDVSNTLDESVEKEFNVMQVIISIKS